MKQGKIIENLDQFIRKYYQSRLIRGGLYALALILVLFLLIVVLEHFGYFSTVVRMCLFWCYWLAMVAIVGLYVVRPLLKMHRLGRVISYDEAARIVGSHFPEIKDKLLNLLQLQREVEQLSSKPLDEDEEPVDTTFLEAAVEQKSRQLSPFHFANAIDLKANRKYVKYAAIPLAVLLVLLLAAPKVITEPSKRLVHNTVEFERPAPFAFHVTNESMEAVQQDDFLLLVEIEGDVVPNEAFVNVDGRQYKMQSQDKTHYTYLFKNLQRTTDFQLEAPGVVSRSYQIKVYPQPTVVAFQARLTYPAYTGIPSELITNVGDLSVPCGTQVTWQFQTKEVDSLFFVIDASPLPYCPDPNGRLAIDKRAMQSFDYEFYTVNNYLHRPSDTLRYAVNVIADVAPMVMAMEMRDSLAPNRIFFQGRVKDDYGFAKMEFKLVKTNEKDTSYNLTLSIPVGLTDEASQDFLYSYNLNELSIQPGDEIRYYFEVWDNDAVHGPKSAVSQTFEIHIPTPEELDNIIDDNYEQIQDEAHEAMSELQQLRSEINEMIARMVDKKELNWHDQKQLESLMQREQQVKEHLEQIKEKLNENNMLDQQHRDQSEELMKKQEEINKLYEKLMNDDLRDLMNQIQRLMDEQDKKKVQQQLENLKMKNEDLERQLDQNLELLKRLEMEQKVEETVRRMDELAQKQRELSQKTADFKGKDQEDLMRQQEQLNKDFEALKKDVEEIQKGYKDIDKSIDFKVDKRLEQKIQQEQRGAHDNLQKGKNRDASKQQKEAADDMEKLSEQLAEAQQELEQSELAEDAEQVRQLLKNLVSLSIHQEELIGMANSTFVQDPKYQHIIKEQNIVREDFRNVRDTLQAMAGRQVAIAAVVNKEVSSLGINLQKSRDALLQYNSTFYNNMKNAAASRSMQASMTSMNNLALVLAESLDQMQNQMRQNEQNKKQGSCKKQGMKMKSGSCSNPGKGKPSAKSMKQMQQELNKQLEALKKQMDKDGKQKAGQRPRPGQQGSMSEEFAKAAAQQEMIRRMMQQYGQELKQQSGGNAKLAREIDEMMRQMEQTETELVNKTITQQTIKRQQQIMTRMLEHEKAELERDKEERRQSKEAKEQYQPSPSDMERYNKLQERNMELFRTFPPTLSPFYKQKVNEYFYKF